MLVLGYLWAKYTCTWMTWPCHPHQPFLLFFWSPGRRIYLEWVTHLQQNTINFAGYLSSTSPVTWGVPLGSVLGLVLLLLYTADIFHNARCYSIGTHSYTNDTLLSYHAAVDLCVASISAMVSCMNKLNRWMCCNRLKLNTAKMDFTLLGMRQQL